MLDGIELNSQTYKQEIEELQKENEDLKKDNELKQSHVNQLISSLKNEFAEKKALDRSLLDSLRELVKVRKEYNLLEDSNKELDARIKVLENPPCKL